MIKGLMITPPAIGRIAIGKVVERNGRRLPEKDDEFTITTQVQSRGQWILHPLDEALRQAVDPRHDTTKAGSSPALPDDAAEAAIPPLQPKITPAPARPGRRSLKEKMGIADSSAMTGNVSEAATAPPAPATTPARRKLRCIPVRVLFNDPDLNLRANYTLFDRATARPVCVGDGESCKRLTGKGLESLPCPGPDACSFSKEGCKPYGRLNLVIGDSDELGSFVFRTTGVNSIRTLTARLQYFAAASGGHLACMPLELKLRGKSTTQSHRAAIYYADLVVRTGLSLGEAIGQAKALSAQRHTAGFDQRALDEAARLGYANGCFEDAPDEAADIAQEFYPEPEQSAASDQHTAGPAEKHDSKPEQWGSPMQPSRPSMRRNGTHSPYAQ